MQQAELRIEGMNYTSCADNIEKALRILPGILKARVNFESHTAFVEYDDSQIDVERMVAIIDHSGYQASKAQIIR